MPVDSRSVCGVILRLLGRMLRQWRAEGRRGARVWSERGEALYLSTQVLRDLSRITACTSSLSRPPDQIPDPRRFCSGRHGDLARFRHALRRFHKRHRATVASGGALQTLQNHLEVKKTQKSKTIEDDP